MPIPIWAAKIGLAASNTSAKILVFMISFPSSSSLDANTLPIDFSFIP
jgi:hypothetical protein